MDADRIAPKLYGHPVAARLVAGLLGNHSVDFLEHYPQELVALRRDLARVLLQDLTLAPASDVLMETLALAGTGLPASVLTAISTSLEDFQFAVAQCANAGLITADRDIETHPLFQDFFWHRLHRGDYQQRALRLAGALRSHLEGMDKTSPGFAALLPVTFRAFALAGDLETATLLRRDLTGELSSAAITLYNRRDYELADKYSSQVLDGNPKDWSMRLYRGRLRVRQERWEEADRIFAEMLLERPADIRVLHAKGWCQLRQRNWERALQVFTSVIAKRPHVASLRDAAECLHRLQRNTEALKFLERAKEEESENPYVLDLESRILEDLGELDAAYDSARLAAARDPLNDRLHNRLGLIRVKQGRTQQAIDHFIRAIELDPEQFSPANSLAAAYLELDEWEKAELLLPDLKKKSRTPSNFALLAHTSARIAFEKKDLIASKELLSGEIAGSRNVIPNLGMLIQVLCALFDSAHTLYPTIASVHLKEAENAIAKLTEIDPDNRFIDGLRRSVSDRQPKRP